MKKISIMISSAGRRVELINCFRRSAKKIKLDIEIIAIDMSPEWSPACCIADKFYKVPKCTSDDFIEEVINISKKNKVRLIIPTIDTELSVYSENRFLFEQNNIKLLLCSNEFIEIVRNKFKTYEILNLYKIPTPYTESLNNFFSPDKNFDFPVIAKPIDGSRSVGIHILNSKDDFNKLDVKRERYIVQSLKSGKEYTINCFYDNGCQSCIPHYRKYVRDGEVCFAETKRIEEFRKIADKISEIDQSLYGPICFQGIVDENNEITVFEINARFGGGYPICDKAGGKFTEWILKKIAGLKIDYCDEWDEGVRMLRFDSAIFSNR